MTLHRTPEATGNMPRCNNTERQWFAGASARATTLRIRAQALHHDLSTTIGQANDLLRIIRDSHRADTEEWRNILARMRENARDEAVNQAAARWSTIEGSYQEAIRAVQTIRQQQGVEASPQASDEAQGAPHQLPRTPPGARALPLSPPGASPVRPPPGEQAERPQVGLVEPPVGDHESGGGLGAVPRRQSTPRRRRRHRRQQSQVWRDEANSNGSDPPPPYDDEAERVRRELGETRGQLQAVRRAAAQDHIAETQRNQRLQQENRHQRQELEELRRQLQEARISVRRGRLTSETHTEATGGRQRQRSPVGARERLHRPVSSPPGTRVRREQERGSPPHDRSSQEPPRRVLFREPPAVQMPDLNRPPPHHFAATGGLRRGGLEAEPHSRFDQYLRAPYNPVRNPFTPTLEDENDDYYLNSFPCPFNVPPPPDAVRITDFRKLDGLVTKFDGEEENFPAWTALFIPVIHQARCPVAWKAVQLSKCLDTTVPRLRSILAGAGASKDDYARVVSRLVRAYAHPAGLLASRARALQKIEYVTAHDYVKIEDWLNRLESYMDTANATNRQADIFSTQLYEDNLNKMEESMAYAFLSWADYRGLPQHTVTLARWLERRLEDCKTVRQGRPLRTASSNTQLVAAQHQGSATGRNQTGTYQSTTSAGPATRYPCPMDGQLHYLTKCTIFLALTPTERRAKLRDWRRCYSCFSTAHNMKACTRAIRCEKCPRRHHTLLHGSATTSRGPQQAARNFMAATEEVEDSWSESSEVEVETDVRAYTTKQTNKPVALQTLPVDVYNKGKKITLNCLIDQGATGAFMSRRAAEALQVTGHSAITSVTGFGGQVTRGAVLIADVQVAEAGTKRKHWVQLQVSEDPAASYQPHDWTRTQQLYPHLKNLPIKPPVGGKGVDLMLGMDTPELVCSLAPDVGGTTREDPVARLTRLGWIVGGPLPGATRSQARAHFAFLTKPCNPNGHAEAAGWTSHTFKTVTPDARDPPKITRTRDEDLTTLVARMWEVDNSMGKSAASIQDEKIFTFLRDRLSVVGEKYMLPTLWRSPDIRPPNNFRYAEARLKSLLAGPLFRDERVYNSYNTQIKEWLKDEYVQEIVTNTPEKDKGYYLPHFAVVRWAKQSTQVRVVMDGAARAGKNPCLNDCLLKGPKLVNELPTVLMRFRLREICFAADVRKMFFQIGMLPEDRPYHRFLWKENERLKVYQWAVHPFGSAASPCVAIFSIKEHAGRYKAEYPQAAETVIKSTLVDDNLDSRQTVEEAVTLGRQLVELFGKAGMRLGKIISNSQEVLSKFPSDMISPTLDLAHMAAEDLATPIVKTLGIIYSAKSDQFSFRMESPTAKTWTKRSILRYEATLYDVHGLITPHVIKARMIIQLLWQQGKGWDEPVDGEPAKMWHDWLLASQQLSHIRVARAVSSRSTDEPQFHIFCDASAEAYAAAAYYVTEETSRLLVSRARVAPIKAVSIPRLELMGAELATEVLVLLRTVFDIMGDQLSMWTDSMNVLCWLKSESRTLNAFVANRVSRILDHTLVKQWHWVPSGQNPADIPSRGMLADKLVASELWWSGPAFLRGGGGRWPEQPQLLEHTAEAKSEIKKGMSFKLTTNHIMLLGYKDSYQQQMDDWKHMSCSTWTKLVGSFKIMYSWRWNKKEAEKRAEVRVLQIMQGSALARTLQRLQLGHAAPTDSPIMKLRPVLDSDGLIRVGGVLTQLQSLSYDQRHQIILPKDHPWTALLIRHVHSDLLHQGPKHVQVALSRRYWLVQPIRTIAKAIKGCVPCRRQRPGADPQAMAPVLQERIPEKRCDPFLYTALDMAGPYYIKEAAQVMKAYFILFTCITFRAVHLEPVTDMTAQSFLAAMQRFTARRGCPATVRADNGSNFLAASADLMAFWKKAEQRTKEKWPQIIWIFNPPRAPHMGGLFERMIGAVKRALYHTFRVDMPVTREQFHTALVVVEGMLNTRPITTLRENPTELAPLTPAHFLAIPPYRDLARSPGKEWDKRTEWRALQGHLDRIWEQFCGHMAVSLQQQQKWFKRTTPLKENDVVIMLDKKRRGVWPLGRIVRTENSRDGLVRKVHVLTAGNTVRRSVHGLVLLVPGPDEVTQHQNQSRGPEEEREGQK